MPQVFWKSNDGPTDAEILANVGSEDDSDSGLSEGGEVPSNVDGDDVSCKDDST